MRRGNYVPLGTDTGIDDLIDEVAYLETSITGNPQPKFKECEGCPLQGCSRTRELEDILYADILVVGSRPFDEAKRFNFPGDFPKKKGAFNGGPYRASEWWPFQKFFSKNRHRSGKKPIKFVTTTAVMCYSKDHESKNSPIGAIKKCREVFKRKLFASTAKVVVLMGLQACKTSPVPSLHKLTSIDSVRGQIIPYSVGGRTVFFIPTRSIRHVSKNPRIWTTILQDLRKSIAVFDRGFKVPDLKDLTKKYVYPTSGLEVKKALKGYMNDPTKTVSVDIETTGLDHWDPTGQITVLSITVEPGKSIGIYVHCASKGVIAACCEFLRGRTKKIFHNSVFDLSWILLKWDVLVENLFVDTMLAHYCLDENRAGDEERSFKGEYTLKKLAWDYLWEYGGYEEDGDIQACFKAGRWYDIPKAKLLEYACLDTDVTLQLYQKQLRLLCGLPMYSDKELVLSHLRDKRNVKDRALYSLMTRFMSRAAYAVVKMSYWGMYVDQEYLEFLEKKVKTELEDVLAETRAMTGIEDLDLNKNAHIIKVIHGVLKLPVLKKTARGQPSTSKDILEKLSEKDTTGIVDKIRTYKILNKTMGNFLQNIRAQIKSDGRVHPKYKITGTVTGRLSCSNPNLQQLPKVMKLPDGRKLELKRLFSAAPGNILLYADYSQVEMRVIAAFADYLGDSSMKEAIQNGLDLHCFVASKVFKVPYDLLFEKGKEGWLDADGNHCVDPKYAGMRSKAKAVGFAILYGSTAWGVAQNTGMTVQEAQDLIDEFYKVFPGIRTFVENKHDEAQTYGYVTTPFGRRRRFPIREVRNRLDNSSKRKAQNSPVQGTASDVCLISVITLVEEIEKLGGKVVVTVHDSIIIEIPDTQEAVLKASELMEDIMVTRPKKDYEFMRGISLKADHEIGHNWGILEPMEVWRKRYGLCA